MQTMMIFNVFKVLISESLTFFCCFIDASLMILWRNIDEATKIPVQTLKIIIVFTVLICETLMPHWWFVAEYLRKHWWNPWKQWRSLLITKYQFFQNLFVLCHCWFMCHWHLVHRMSKNFTCGLPFRFYELVRDKN